MLSNPFYYTYYVIVCNTFSDVTIVIFNKPLIIHCATIAVSFSFQINYIVKLPRICDIHKWVYRIYQYNNSDDTEMLGQMRLLQLLQIKSLG